MTRSISNLSLPLVALVLALAPALEAQPRATVRESVFDFGVVARGDEVEHTFRIANEGDKTLEIVEVKPTCGCTIVDFDRRIQAGGSGKLVATVNTKGLRGAIAKSIEVYTNDSRNPQIDLVLKANVLAYVEATPGYARFLTVLGQGADPIQQTIYSEEPGDFVVTGIRSPHNFIKVKFSEATDEQRLEGKEGRQWVVETRVAPDAPEGGFADFVTLTLDHPKLRRLLLPVSGFVRPVVAVLPRIADFGRKELKTKPQVAVLEVKNLGKRDVTLGEVESDVVGLTPEVEVIDEGRLFKLRLTLDPSMPKGNFSGKLTIPTSSELQPVVEVDVRGTII